MKSLSNIFLFLFLTISSSLPSTLIAQNPENATEIVFVISPTDMKKAERVKQAKAFNADLKEVVEKYWELDFGYSFMTRKAAYKYAKTDIGILVGSFGTDSQINGIRTETSFEIFRLKKSKKFLEVRLPAFFIDKVDMVYAIMHAQFMYRNLHTFEKPSKELPKKYGHILKEKTLLIANSHLGKKLTESKLKSVYPYKFKLVSYSEIEKAILAKDENVIVLYKASEAGNVTEANYPYWSVYQPSDGVVITRHGGSGKGLSKADVALFVKRCK